MSLQLQPIDFAEACRFIRRYHRHHEPSVGWKFGIAVSINSEVRGVVMVGRPVARHLQDGWTLEVTRLCADPEWAECVREARKEGIKLGSIPSFLYAAAWKATRSLGYRRLITYTLVTEPGTSLRAAGWKEIGVRGGGEWNCPSRPRVAKAPTCQKTLWEAIS